MTQTGLQNFSRQVVEIMPILLREFARREDNDLTRGKISCPQMVTLHYVAHHGRVNMNEIASVLAVQMSSATTLVARLVREGMLARSRDETDRRLVWVRITPKGKKVVRQILEQKRKSIREIFGVLSVRERRDYLNALLKIQRRLSQKMGNKA